MIFSLIHAIHLIHSLYIKGLIYILPDTLSDTEAGNLIQKRRNRQGQNKMQNHISFMTSQEIGHLTQTAHDLVLDRACNQLIAAGIDPNVFWSDYADYDDGLIKKRLHLPKKECLLSINDPWYSDKAIAEVLAVWNAWDLEEV